MLTFKECLKIIIVFLEIWLIFLFLLRHLWAVTMSAIPLNLQMEYWKDGILEGVLSFFLELKVCFRRNEKLLF